MARKEKEGSKELEVGTNRQRRDLESQLANGQTDHRVGLLVLQLPAQPLPLWKCQSEAGLVLGRRVPQGELRSLDRFIEHDGGIQGE